MELSKLKDRQRYMTDFELKYRSFQWMTQRDQIFITFHFKIEAIFETLETVNEDMWIAH